LKIEDFDQIFPYIANAKVGFLPLYENNNNNDIFCSPHERMIATKQKRKGAVKFKRRKKKKKKECVSSVQPNKFEYTTIRVRT